MIEIDDWNGHHVLAIPTGLRDPVCKARVDAVWSLADDLGLPADSMPCWLCPMYRADVKIGRRRCGHPRGIDWAVDTDVAQGGCRQRVIIAEEYIPLVQMRLGEQT